MLFAEGNWADPDTIARLINQVGFPISLFVFGAVIVVYLLRTYGPSYKAKLEADKKLVEVISENHPKVTETLRILSEKSSDVVRKVGSVQEGVEKAQEGIDEIRESLDASSVSTVKRRQKSVHPELSE